MPRLAVVALPEASPAVEPAQACRLSHRRSSYRAAARSPAPQVRHNDTRSSSYSSESCRMEAQRCWSIRRDRGPPDSLKVATTEGAVIEAPLEAPWSSPSLALRWRSPARGTPFRSRLADGAIVLRVRLAGPPRPAKSLDPGWAFFDACRPSERRWNCPRSSSAALLPAMRISERASDLEIDPVVVCSASARLSTSKPALARWASRRRAPCR